MWDVFMFGHNSKLTTLQQSPVFGIFEIIIMYKNSVLQKMILIFTL